LGVHCAQTYQRCRRPSVVLHFGQSADKPKFDKQLGLKLEKGTHPLSVVVIDPAEEKPVE
jgi:hypothetical protein